MFKPPSLTDTVVSLKRKLKGTVIKEAEGLLRTRSLDQIVSASDVTREVLSKITDDGVLHLGGMSEAQELQRIVLSKIRDVLTMKGTGMFYFHKLHSFLYVPELLIGLLAWCIGPIE